MPGADFIYIIILPYKYIDSRLVKMLALIIIFFGIGKVFTIIFRKSELHSPEFVKLFPPPTGRADILHSENEYTIDSKIYQQFHHDNIFKLYWKYLEIFSVLKIFLKKSLTFFRFYCLNYWTDKILYSFFGGVVMWVMFMLAPLLTVFSPFLGLSLVFNEGLSALLTYLSELFNLVNI